MSNDSEEGNVSDDDDDDDQQIRSCLLSKNTVHSPHKDLE
jgi:hypothetical protein